MTMSSWRAIHEEDETELPWQIQPASPTSDVWRPDPDPPPVGNPHEPWRAEVIPHDCPWKVQGENPVPPYPDRPWRSIPLLDNEPPWAIPDVQSPPNRPPPLPAQSASLLRYAEKHQNADAVEWGGGITVSEDGVHMRRTQMLLARLPRTARRGSLRAGDEIRLVAVNTRRVQVMRIRFTTPARYYAPGRRVATLRIGVDSRDWELLMDREPKPV
jgi:hypothetical protein